MPDQQLYPLFLVGRIDSLDELVLQHCLVHDVPDPENHLEGDAVVPQGVVADLGLEACDAVLTVFQDVPGHGEGHILHVLQVVAVGHGDGDEDGALRQGLLVVRERRIGDALIRHNHHISRGRTDGGIPPVHVHHPSRVAAGKADIVPHVHLLRHQRRDAGEKVGQRILESESRCQAAGTQGREERGNRDAVGRQDEEDPHHIDAEIHHRSEDGGGGLLVPALRQLILQERRDTVGAEKGHRNDDHAVVVVRQHFLHEGRQVQDILRQLDAQKDPQERRHETEDVPPALPGHLRHPAQHLDEDTEDPVKDDDPHQDEKDKSHEMHMGSPMLQLPLHHRNYTIHIHSLRILDYDR